MASVPEFYSKLKGDYPEAFVECAGGSTVARLINRNGLPVEVGEQRSGFWLPSFVPSGYFGISLGLPQRRERLIIQRSVRVKGEPGSEAFVSTYKYLDGEDHPRIKTVPRKNGDVLDLNIKAIAGSTRVLSAEQAAQYNAETAGLPDDEAVKYGLDLYGRREGCIGYLALGILE